MDQVPLRALTHVATITNPNEPISGSMPFA